MVQKRRTPTKNNKRNIEYSDSESCPSSPESHIEGITQEWATEWLAHEGVANRSNWVLNSPKFKFCKKRKEYFTERFDEIWYKAPYKYNALLNFNHNSSLERAPLVQATLSILFEDGTPIDFNTDDGQPAISKTETIFRSRQTGTSNREVKLGPFQFNVCSYKYDSKRFRLKLNFHLVESDSSIDQKETDLQDISSMAATFIPMCTMISPAFLIKAKKPIAKPGIKSKKRPREETAEKQRQEEISLSPVNAHNSGVEINHIPITASYATHIGHLDIATLITLPVETQKKYLENQLMTYNSIINNMSQGMGYPPLEPPMKKIKQEHVTPYNVPTMVNYSAPTMYTQVQYASQEMIPSYHQYQPIQQLNEEEPFKSLEMLTVDELNDDLFDRIDAQSQCMVFDHLDSYSGAAQLVNAGMDFFL